MPDLLATAQFPFIRMSSTAHCRREIASKMLGLEEHTRSGNTLGMDMGTYLEPMIVKYIADWGLTSFYVGDEQLEIVSSDPYRVGHNDGLVALMGATQGVRLSSFLQRNLPPIAADLLQSGKLLMLEMKTMNGATFTQVRRGGLKATAFTKGYLDQVYAYMGSWLEAANDELWLDHDDVDDDGRVTHVFGSGSFKDLLRANGWERPDGCLVVIFSPELKDWHFEYVPFDRDSYDARSGELQEMIDTMHAGELPAPDFDGSAPQCYFCAFTKECPAVDRTIKLRTIDEIPIMMSEGGQQLDELAAAYDEYRAAEKDLKQAKEAMNKQIKALVGAGRAPIITAGYLVQNETTKGRRGIDLVKLASMVGGKENIPYKTGNPGTRLTVKPLFGPAAKDDDTGDGE